MSQKIDEPVPNESGERSLEVNPVNGVPSNVNQPPLDGSQEYVVSYMQNGNSDPTGYEPVQTIPDNQTGYEPMQAISGNLAGQYDNEHAFQTISGNTYQTGNEQVRTILDNQTVHYDNQHGDNQNQQTLEREPLPLAPVDAPATVPLSSNYNLETEANDKGAENQQNVSVGSAVVFDGRKFTKRVFDANINGYVYITDDTPGPRGGLLM